MIREKLESLDTSTVACPRMSLLIDRDGGSVELILDTSIPTYGEWIKGEGGDICLYRDQETHKVMGACLPLYQSHLTVDWI